MYRKTEVGGLYRYISAVSDIGAVGDNCVSGGGNAGIVVVAHFKLEEIAEIIGSVENNTACTERGIAPPGCDADILPAVAGRCCIGDENTIAIDKRQAVATVVDTG